MKWPWTKSEPKGERVIFAVGGLHCSSCALNIDGTLEDTPGVYRSQTSYARGKTTIEYDPARIEVTQLQQIMKNLGYTTRTTA